MKDKIDIETSSCFGCGLCADLCPDVFGFDDNELKARVIDQDAAAEVLVDEAIQSCPAQCISWQTLACDRCDTCTRMCADIFADFEHESMVEIVSLTGSLEDCLEVADECCYEDFSD